MPDKKPNESREDFLTRCMGDSEMNRELSWSKSKLKELDLLNE